MAISQIPVASSGLSTSDLITQPTWTLIGSNTSSSTLYTSVSLSSIPQTYKNLKIVMPYVYLQDYQNGYAMGLQMRLNNNSGTIYHGNGVRRYYQSASPYAQSMGAYGHNGASSISLIAGNTTYGYTGEIIIENYSSSTEYKNVYTKSYFNDSSNQPNEVQLQILFGSTSPITSIDFFASQSYFMMIPNQSSYTGKGILIYGAK